MAVMMSAAPALMHDDSIDNFVSVTARVVEGDRIAWLERMIIHWAAAIVEELNVSAMIESPLLIANAEADVVGTIPAPTAVEVVGHRRHRQSGRDNCENEDKFFHKDKRIIWVSDCRDGRFG